MTMLSPSAAPRWMMNTKRRSVATVASAMRGATRIAPAPSAEKDRNWRRSAMTLSPQEIGGNQQQGECAGRAFGACHLFLGGGTECSGHQFRAQRACIQ